jgi:hypothetical protein
VKALADSEVGDYLNSHFVCSFQKVGTFRLVNGKKQGGNVASYFCTPDGGVLHVVPGPVDAATLLDEARWAVETRELGLLDNGDLAKFNLAKFKQFFRKAHADRLPKRIDLADYPRSRLNRGRESELEALYWQRLPLPAPTPAALKALLKSAWGLDKQEQVHLVLAVYPVIKLDQLYRVVFEDILREKVSTRPVTQELSKR